MVAMPSAMTKCAVAVDVEDAPVDPLPMENVLRPSIDGAEDSAEHVFQAERHACPAVGLDLRHGNNEVPQLECSAVSTANRVP